MGIFIGLKEKKDIDAAYFYLMQEVRTKALNESYRLRNRLERLKEIEYDQIEKIIETEVSIMDPEEIVGTMDEYYADKYLEIDGYKVSYQKALKRDPEKVAKLFEKDLEIERKELIWKLTRQARDQYFLAKNLTDDQLEEYISLSYASDLENALIDARVKSAIKVKKEKHKLSRNLNSKKIKRTDLIWEDIEEVKKIGKVGDIERVVMLDERQKRKRDDLRQVHLPTLPFFFPGFTAIFGAYVSELLTKSTGRTDAFGTIGGMIIGYAAGQAAISAVNRTFSDEAKIKEAKDLGIYEAMLRAEEACERYREYKKQVMNQLSSKIKEQEEIERQKEDEEEEEDLDELVGKGRNK